jgi:hypothetical protein
MLCHIWGQMLKPEGSKSFHHSLLLPRRSPTDHQAACVVGPLHGWYRCNNRDQQSHYSFNTFFAKRDMHILFSLGLLLTERGAHTWFFSPAFLYGFVLIRLLAIWRGGLRVLPPCGAQGHAVMLRFMLLSCFVIALGK